MLAMYSAGSLYDLVTLPTRFHLDNGYKVDRLVVTAVDALGAIGCFMAARQCFSRDRRDSMDATGVELPTSR